MHNNTMFPVTEPYVDQMISAAMHSAPYTHRGSHSPTNYKVGLTTQDIETYFSWCNMPFSWMMSAQNVTQNGKTD